MARRKFPIGRGRRQRRRKLCRPQQTLDRRQLRFEPLEQRRLLAQVTVTTDQDVVDFNDGVTSLREAIFATNTVPGADTINFDFGFDSGLGGPATILLTQGELAITDSLSIEGYGAELVTIDAQQQSRIFRIFDDDLTREFDVSISGLTLTGGSAIVGGSASLGDTRTSGGAILSLENLVLTSTVVTGNIAGRGGGIDSRFGTLTINDSLISNNTSYQSGGGINASNRLTLSNSTVTNNTTYGNGGGISNGTSITVTASMITENKAERSGGGIDALNDAVIYDSVISGNSSGGRFPFGGGGISVGRYNSEANIDIRRSTITGNSTSAGGGGIMASVGRGAAVLEDNTIAENSSGFEGGGLFLHVEGGHATVDRNVIRDNSAHAGAGVSVYLSRPLDPGGQESEVVISRSLIQNNRISVGNPLTGGVGDGGGIHVQGFEGGTVYVRESAILENTWADDIDDALNSGGGIQIIRGTLIVESSTIARNEAGRGGGVYVGRDSHAQFFQSTISSNSAREGGGIYIQDAAGLTLDHSTVTSNTAIGGGGILNLTTGPVAIWHSIVAGNQGGIFYDPITGMPSNTSDFAGRSLSEVTLEHSIIGAKDRGAESGVPTDLPDANGNLIGGVLEENRIDPLLGPLADNGGFTLPDGSTILTHALLVGSPAINAGDLNAVPGEDGVPLYDQRGEPFGRIVSGRIDIGAFEYQESSDLNLLVDTLTDENDGDYSRYDVSLREAIALANANPGHDTIHFDPVLWAAFTPLPATILLTMGELVIADDLTIDGPGAELLAIDAQQQSRIFNIFDGDTRNVIDVSISGLTLTGGNLLAAGGASLGDTRVSGGAILSLENLSLTSVVVAGNSAVNGGGIDASFGMLTVVDSTVSDNVSLNRGGGINAGHLTIHSSKISNNRAGEGGGIQTAGSLTMHTSAILNNTAFDSGGGGIHAPYGDVKVFDSLIAGNSVEGGSSRRGGGIALSRYVGTNSIEVRRSTITGNTSGGVGGGIAAGILNSAAVFEDNIIEENSAVRNGGGVYLHVMDGIGTFERNVIRDNTAANGAGIGSQMSSSSDLSDEGGPKIIVSGSLIQGNSLTRGGNPLTNAPGDGAGIFVRGTENGELLIRESEIRENSLAEDIDADAEYVYSSGGGIYFSQGTFVVEASTIADNSAIHGGGIYVDRGSDAQVIQSTISGNVAATDGGGIFTLGGRLTITDSTVATNTAGGDGGGIANSGVLASFQRNTVRGNTAGHDGGGLANFTSSFEIVDNTFDNNSAGRNGGGIVALVGPFTMTNSTLSGNVASALGGGTWTVGATTIRHATIVGNHADVAGGGAFASFGPLNLNHTVVATNTSFMGPDVTGLLGVSIDAHFSLIGNNSSSGLSPAPVGSPDANGNVVGGAGSAAINPLLGPLANNGGPTQTHAPLARSPAINAGDPVAQAGAGSVPMHDQRGAPFTRVFGGRIDIGAVESQPSGVLFGDYNGNGVVDTADYTKWRDTLGRTVDPGTGADGNGDGIVDTWDNQLWAANFGTAMDALPPLVGGAALGQFVDETAALASEPATAVGGAEIRSEANADIAFSQLPPVMKTRVASPGTGELPQSRRQLFYDTPRHDRLLEAWLAARREQRQAFSAPPEAVDGGEESTTAVDEVFTEIGDDEPLTVAFAT